MIAEYVGTTLNNELYPSLPATRQRMIENNMGLVRRRVDGYIRRVPSAAYLADDLLSEGYLALVEAVDRLAKTKECPDVTAYISLAIRNAVDKHFNDDGTIGPCAKTKSRARVNDVELQTPQCEPLLDHDIAETGSFSSGIETLEELLACCGNETEKQIVELKLDGLKQAQIAERLSLTQSTVCRLLAKIAARYGERNCD